MFDNYERLDTSEPGNRSGNLPFFATRFRGRAVAIRRNPDFDATVSSILHAFPALEKISPDSLVILARFDDFGDLDVQITRDLWEDVLPRLRIVDVSIRDEEAEVIEKEMVSLSITDSASPEEIQISILSGPREFSVSIAGNATVKHLKSLISERDSLEPLYPILGFDDFASLEDDKTLGDYGISHGSSVTVTSNLPVFITTANRPKVPMMITLYATVSSLKLVIRTRLDVPANEQTLTCEGEQLDDSKPLGRYPQISRNCEILVSRTAGQQDPPLIFLYVKPAWAQDDDDDTESCLVLPTSTILDVKVLLFNINMISPCQQQLSFHGKPLNDDRTIQENGLQTGSLLLLKIHQRGGRGEV
ncbi:hypothetical protein BDV93DRAFT_527291 [Ceratobasidium sp. AG-I]|nr:hypothetical protein BDV93DRAFT_527291 [Ceratobasidium sp. AG-I]